MPTPRTARVIAFMLALSVGLVGFGAPATASEFTKKVKKTVTVYTSAQKTWDRTDTDGGPEGGSAGDIVYFSGQYFPTLAAARSMEASSYVETVTISGMREP